MPETTVSLEKLSIAVARMLVRKQAVAQAEQGGHKILLVGVQMHNPILTVESGL
jgi:hypothetical protein